MTDQADLFGGSTPTGNGRGSIADRFWAFHLKNPRVYTKLVELARGLKEKGHQKGGIGMLWEILRWQRMMTTADPSQDEYKLCNDYRAEYARLIMSKEPDLEGFFETRELRRVS